LINIIEGFVSDKECQELFEHYNLKIWDAEDPFVKTGFGVGKDEALDLYNKDNLLSDIVKRIGTHLSSHYGEDIELKSLFHSVMTPGAVNPLHWDNYIENGQDDISTLFYLNEDYVGGELHFPNQNKIIKPKAGTFIFFKGEESLMHEVKEVIEGNRNAFVGFFWPTRTRISITS
jgi:Rps23 Pro-64 3,4-dihydroxylase Tpa1-like proline 4-hydroxylase